MHQLLTIMQMPLALVTDPTWVFFVVLMIILFSPILLRRLRTPHIIGLILAGVMIGQHGFNIIERDRSFEIFGQVGIYFIMFIAALEMNMGSVHQYGRKGLIFGLVTYAIPFATGFLAAYYLLGFGATTSVLLSCILASHTLISYPIVGRYGMTRHPVVIVSVVATAVALFVALLVLAIAVGTLQETTWMFWVLFAFKCVVYGGFIIYVYPKIGRWFLRRYDDTIMQFIFVLSLVFLSAALAELAGLEGLLGAFLAGLSINRLIPRTSPLMSYIQFVGNALFIPYFLIGVGMLIDLKVLFGDLNTIWIVLVMVLVGTLSKWLASYVMSFVSKELKGGSLLMFGLTNAHAAGALAIVMIGTDPKVNLMDVSVLNGTVMLILFSCIISSFATNEGARRLALMDMDTEENQGAWHGKCLVTYSQPDSVGLLTQLALVIRNTRIPDSLMGLTVTFNDYDGEAEGYRDAQRMLEDATSVASAAQVDMKTLSRLSTNVAGGILHTIREYDCGEVMVCLTDRTTGMPKSSLGPIIDHVLEGTNRQVMAVRLIVPPGTLHRVIVAVPQKAEYEAGFYKWLEHVCRMGEQLDCRLEFHAHPDTMANIRNYMWRYHVALRAEYIEMALWTKIMSLSQRAGSDDMVVFISARPGFISYKGAFAGLPLMIHRYFSHTSVMLLYPDQWS
ncbi:MAG: cation:proton antiporter [Bacteroidaceae bacterium]|nr:cation:proton antiporter [Bacteroidaceae bacterium]